MYKGILDLNKSLKTYIGEFQMGYWVLDTIVKKKVVQKAARLNCFRIKISIIF